MRIAIATIQVPFVRGGAEMLAENLRDALDRAGHRAEIVSMPFRNHPPERIPPQILAARLFDLEESCGSRIDRLIGLKFPAYLMHHSNKVLWLLHQHREAYDIWDAGHGALFKQPRGEEVRDIVRDADRRLIPESLALYTISRNVTARLKHFSGIDSTPLYHPPPHAECYCSRSPENFFLLPSRFTAMKRQHLVVESLARTRNPVRVVFIGAADEPTYEAATRTSATESLAVDRVLWRGGVSDGEKVELYGRCLGVIFPALDEDYGYVTLEAMLSSKPVVTCTDSGGPLEFVDDGETGLVTAPEPAALAAALDRLWEDRELARRMGEAGRARYCDMAIGWDRVVECLLA